MPTFTPDVDPTTLSKVLIPITNQSDQRWFVFYQTLTDSNQTGVTSGDHGPERLVTLLKTSFKSGVVVGAGLVEHPDGTARTVTVSGAGSDSDSSALTVSNLAYHHIFKDTRRRACGHYLHSVSEGWINDAALQTGADLTGNSPVNFVAEMASGHFYTKTGYKYTAYLHTRLVYKRSRSTGGAGRKLSIRRAEAFLRRHGVTTIPPA